MAFANTHLSFSRLQRFDAAQEEAALDLGASNAQFFRHVLLPYLRPAIVSAAALAFLASCRMYSMKPRCPPMWVAAIHA